MIKLYAQIVCLFFLLANVAWRIVFESQLYVIVMYSFPLIDRIGKRPQSSVYSLLIGSSQICSSFVLMGCGISSRSSTGASFKIYPVTIKGGVFFFLVDCTT